MRGAVGQVNGVFARFQCQRAEHGVGLQQLGFLAVYRSGPAVAVGNGQQQNLGPVQGHGAVYRVCADLDILQRILRQFCHLSVCVCHRLLQHLQGAEIIDTPCVKSDGNICLGIFAVAGIDCIGFVTVKAQLIRRSKV